MMLLAVFKQSLKELTRVSRIGVWILLALLAVPLCLLISNVTDTSANHISAGYYAAVLIFYSYRVGTLAAAILTTAILNAEVEQKTIVYLTTRPLPRWQFIVGRYLACTVAVSIISVIAILATGIAAFGGSMFSKGPIAIDILTVILGSAAYCGLFLLFSVLTNRALILNLLIAFGWELFVFQLPGSAYLYSIFSYMTGLHTSAKNGSLNVGILANSITFHDISGTTCVIALIAISVVTCGIAALVYSVSEFIPKEQAA